MRSPMISTAADGVGAKREFLSRYLPTRVSWTV